MLKQATGLALFSIALVCGQSESLSSSFVYDPPVVKKVIFGDAVMLEQPDAFCSQGLTIPSNTQ